MRRIVKWGCLGTIGLVIVVGVIGALASGGKPAATPTTVAQAPQPTAAPVATAAPTAVPAKPVPTVAPTKPPATLAKVGERVESAGVALTVNEVSKAASLGSIWKAKDGNTYLVADITVENTSRDKSPYNPFYFKVKDSDGYEYTTAMGAGDKALKSGELAAGDKARGTVAFEVPVGAKGFVASYQPMVLLGGYQVIRIALD